MSTEQGGGADVAALEKRVAQLEEQYEEGGQGVSLGGLLNAGLSRRQALKAVGLVGAGVALPSAIAQSASAQNAITGIDQLGEENDRIGTIFAENIDTDTFTQSTDAISADSISTGEEINGVQTPQIADDIVTKIENASDGDSIDLPPGEFTVDNPINVNSDITVDGAGMGSTILTKQNDDVGISVGDCTPTLNDFRIVGDGSEESPGSHGIVSTPDSTTPVHMNRIRPQSNGGDGFYLQSANQSLLEGLNPTYNEGYGIRTGGSDANAYTLINLNASNNGKDGYYNDGSYGVTLIGGYAPYNGGYGFRIDDDGGTYWGLGGEGNDDDVVLVDENANRNLVTMSPTPDGDADFNTGTGENTVLRHGSNTLDFRGPGVNFRMDDGNGDPQPILQTNANANVAYFANGFEKGNLAADVVEHTGSETIIARNDSDPSNPDDGTVWYRSDIDEFRGQEGGEVVTFDTTPI